jgi:tRNA (cytidine/uridine-2'-O-)-methyltransferase
MIRLALYQPDIPQNVGAAIRLAACLGVPLDLIEPFGFPWNEAKIRQSGMDYTDLAVVTRHASWEEFLSRHTNGPLDTQSLPLGEGQGPFEHQGALGPSAAAASVLGRNKSLGVDPVPSPRLILLTTRGSVPYTEIAYRPGDVLLAGRESAGVPDAVHAAADMRVLIPMVPGTRSLNVVISCAIVLGEAIRQGSETWLSR